MLTQFDPLIEEWFGEQFGAPTEPQIQGWPVIGGGDDVLISAPTGSGKTLAAFLICLDQLVREARTGALPDETRVVYVSPLKALSNDVRKNLEIPLAQIRELAEKRGVMLAPIRTAVRTGDTPMYERQQMGRKPPHILVTTPESLYILMTAEKPRAMLRTTRTVIVDEIHAMADDKRGSHLSLTLARLDALVENRPQRIGLSATVKPIEEVANFLGPNTRIVNTGHRRDMDLGVLIPRDELGPIATHEMWAELYDRLAELILTHRTTLVFVNTRRLSERIAHALTERLGAGCRRIASRQSFAHGPAGCGNAPEKWRPACRSSYRIARTRHRYRDRGSGGADRLYAVDRGCASAFRPRRALGESHSESAHCGDHAR